MIDALDSAATRWFIQAMESSGKFSLNLLAKSVAIVLRGIGRLTGGGFLEQMAGFITHLNDLFGGFRGRAMQGSEAFRGAEFAYLIISTPAPAALREASFFAERLVEHGMRRDALVVNRVHRRPRAEPNAAQVAQALSAHRIELGGDPVARLLRVIN